MLFTSEDWCCLILFFILLGPARGHKFDREYWADVCGEDMATATEKQGPIYDQVQLTVVLVQKENIDILKRLY